MDIIEQEIKKFLDKWAVCENHRKEMDFDLLHFMRVVAKYYEPEPYTPMRKNL